MRRTLVAAFCAVLFAVPVVAGGGAVCIYSDDTGSACSFTDTGVLLGFHVIHEIDEGATAVQFSAPVPACMNGASWVGDVIPSGFLTLGNSNDGLAITYGRCLGPPYQNAIHVATILVATTGLTSPDCPYPILPDPAALTGRIEGVDCSQTKTFPQGGTAYINSSLACECELATGGPRLGYSPASMDFGLTATHDVLNIFNNGDDQLSWNLTPMASWVGVMPAGGTGSAGVTVHVDRSGLAPGFHSTTIDITSNGGDAQVPVTLSVAAPTPTLGVSPASLSFSASEVEKQLLITNQGTGTLTWDVTHDASWLTVTPNSGSDDAALSVTVDRTGLAEGTHNASIQVASNGGSANVPVTLVVDNSPLLRVSPALLLYDMITTSRTMQISNVGGGTLEWQLSADRSWINIIPPLTGTGNASVTVRIDLTQIPGDRTESGHVFVASNGGTEEIGVRYTPPGSSGQGGAIMIMTDPGFNSCNILDAPGLISLYVVHDLHPGASAVQFAAPIEGQWTGATWIIDQNPFLTVGDSQSGMAISYGACLPGPVLVTTIQVLSQGQGLPCSSVDIRPDPNAPTGQIEAVNCALQKIFPIGGSATINSDGTCSCGITVKVETKTWGGVKALYAPDPGEK